MPPMKYRTRRHEIYFPSSDFLVKWKECAKAAGMPLSKWIFSVVEASLDQADAANTATELIKDQEKQRDQNRALKKELENVLAELEREKTARFKLEHESILSPSPRGKIQLNQKLIDVLKSGGSWIGRDLLRELGINSSDIAAIEIVTRQLHMLQDFELVEEGIRGWRWVAK